MPGIVTVFSTACGRALSGFGTRYSFFSAARGSTRVVRKIGRAFEALIPNP
jgi:hypothetical protein